MCTQGYLGVPGQQNKLWVQMRVRNAPLQRRTHKMKLSDSKLRAATGKTKPYRLADGEGLHLEVKPTGAKLWRFRYRRDGKENVLSLGAYPSITLKEAREARAQYRAWLARGLDPAEERVRTEKEKNPLTFKQVAEEWYAAFSPTWSENTRRTRKPRIEKNLYPHLGDRPIASIEPPHVLATLKKIADRGSLDMAQRVKRYVGQIMRYGIANGYCDRDPTADLKGALPQRPVQHFGSITDPDEIGGLLRAIDQFTGSPFVLYALKLSPYVFLRPTELREAEWTEIDFRDGEWRIPKERMKKGRPHIVPLSRQVAALLQELWKVSGDGYSRFLFPSPRTKDRPFSNMTINATFRRLGYAAGEMTAHGFRSMASTRLHEAGWNSDAIEAQLAHTQGNSVKAAYNYAQHLPERRRIMQWWADYLDELRARR